MDIKNEMVPLPATNWSHIYSLLTMTSVNEKGIIDLPTNSHDALKYLSKDEVIKKMLLVHIYL